LLTIYKLALGNWQGSIESNGRCGNRHHE